MPSNASDTLVYFAGDSVEEDDNESEFVYEWFTSELGDGTAVEGTTYTMYDGDIST